MTSDLTRYHVYDDDPPVVVLGIYLIAALDAVDVAYEKLGSSLAEDVAEWERLAEVCEASAWTP